MAYKAREKEDRELAGKNTVLREEKTKDKLVYGMLIYEQG